MEEKNTKSKLIKLLKSKLLWVIVILLAGGFTYAKFKPEPQPEYTLQAAVMQNLEQTVSVTGSVQGADEIELNFETTGILSKIEVSKGDEVQVGDMLAQLSATNQYNAVLEAQANLQAARATLQKLVAGASFEDVKVSEENVKNAEVTYNNKVNDLEKLRVKLAADEISYQSTVTNQENDLVNKRDSVLNTIGNELFDATAALDRIKDIFENDETQYTLGAQDTVGKNQAEASRANGVVLLNIANSDLATAKITKSENDINQSVISALDALIQTGTALSQMYSVLVNTPPSTTYTQTEIDADRLNISSDQGTITISITNVQSVKTSWDTGKSALLTAQNNYDTFLATKDSQIATAEGTVASAKSSWDLTVAQLNLKRAPARAEDISLQQARVSQAQASLSRSQAALDQMTIYAPVSGVITRIEYEIGEKTDFSKSVIAILGESGLEIEVDIPESDIAKIQSGQTASITLDAFGDDKIYTGHVTFIDPAETVIQDVVYYKVKVTFDDYSNGIKPGMTANIDIVTAQKENILVVPVRAVKQNGNRYVEILVDNQLVKKEVTTGLRGDGGLIEVLSGLNPGEEVVTFIKEVK